jgi:hypothetical protein
LRPNGKEELRMITVVRTSTVAPGKMADAMTFAQQVTKLARDKFDLDVHVSTPIGGNPSRIAFTASYPTLAEVEAMLIKINADADYQNFVAANVATFVPGSAHVELWRSV